VIIKKTKTRINIFFSFISDEIIEQKISGYSFIFVMFILSQCVAGEMSKDKLFEENDRRLRYLSGDKC
jgi:hypothetical protein